MKASKILSIFLIIVLISCLLTACGPKQTDADSNKPEPVESENIKSKISNITLVTGSTTGSFVAIGAGIAEKANDFYEGFPITAIPGPGTIGNIPMVSNGEAQIGMSYPSFLLLAKEGKEPYNKQFTNLRGIAALQPTVVHFIADTNTPVDTVSQLIEEKIPIKLGIPPKGNASHFIAQMIFSAMGYIDPEEIRQYGGHVYYASGSNLNDAWKNRQINSLLSTYNVPAASIQESLIGRKGKILSFDEKIKDLLIKDWGFNEYVIPAGSYEGQDKDVVTLALPTVIFTTEDLEEDVAYNLAKAIYENKTYLEGVHSSFKEFNPDKIAEGLGIELHEGAEKYYKEIGLIK